MILRTHRTFAICITTEFKLLKSVNMKSTVKKQTTYVCICKQDERKDMVKRKQAMNGEYFFM